MRYGLPLKEEDVSKLHSEINQINAHRVQLALGAMAAFAAIGIKMIESFTDPTATNMLSAAITSILLSFLLLLLFYVSQCLRGNLRAYTTYLIVKDASTWELDWRRYRLTNPKYSRWDILSESSVYLGLQSTIFVCLLVLALLHHYYPQGLSEHYVWDSWPFTQSTPDTESRAIQAMVAACVVSVLAAFYMTLRGFGEVECENRMQDAWEHALSGPVSRAPLLPATNPPLPASGHTIGVADITAGDVWPPKTPRRPCELLPPPGCPLYPPQCPLAVCPPSRSGGLV